MKAKEKLIDPREKFCDYVKKLLEEGDIEYAAIIEFRLTYMDTYITSERADKIIKYWEKERRDTNAESKNRSR